MKRNCEEYRKGFQIKKNNKGTVNDGLLTYFGTEILKLYEYKMATFVTTVEVTSWFYPI